MGYGGPEFAKNKDKLSKECKLQRDAPLPPVDQKGFNEDGDCVPEGNVLQQIKVPALLRFHDFVFVRERHVFRASSLILLFF